MPQTTNRRIGERLLTQNEPVPHPMFIVEDDEGLVTVCLTQGMSELLASDAPGRRVRVMSGAGNPEWQAIRGLLMLMSEQARTREARHNAREQRDAE